MTTFFRWLWRALLALLVLAALAGLWVILNFQQWKKERVAELDAGSRIVQTKTGPVEYTEFGSGPPVLVCHGAPGGYDQAALIGAALAKDGFRVIAPSRPGFLRTPLETGILFDDQAAALADLLDQLGVGRVSVVGFSTGAQVAIRFALNYPERTAALVLLSPVTNYTRTRATDEVLLLPEAALDKTSGDIGSWLLLEKIKRMPRKVLEEAFSLDGVRSDGARDKLVDYVASHPAQLQFFEKLLGTQAPLSSREPGSRNDLMLVRPLDPVPYEKLRVPLLVVSGGVDSVPESTDGKAIVANLPFAQSMRSADAGHLIWFGPEADAVQARVREFLRNPPPVPTATPAPSAAPEPAPQATI